MIQYGLDESDLDQWDMGDSWGPVGFIVRLQHLLAGDFLFNSNIGGLPVRENASGHLFREEWF